MKYFKLNKQQQESIAEINLSAMCKIIPQSVNDYWIVSCEYINESDYRVFRELLVQCEVIDVIATEINNEINPYRQSLQTQLSELQAAIETLESQKEKKQKRANNLQQLKVTKAAMQNDISIAMETKIKLKTDIQNLDIQIEKLEIETASKKK